MAVTKLVHKVLKTKKPSGLTITRSGNSFVCQWKISDANYGDGQQFCYKLGKGSWVSVAVGSGVTRKTITINPALYYPTTQKVLTSVQFRVRGVRSHWYETKGTVRTDYYYSLSDWSSKTFTISKPPAPSLTTALHGTLQNTSTFTWSAANDSKSAAWFANVEYQTIRVWDNDTQSGAALNWGAASVTKSASGTETITESNAEVAAHSVIRWVRVRSKGPAGCSAWKYAWHVYARPYAANVLSATARDSTTGGYQCSVTWNAQASWSHPIDKTVVQYGFGAPETGTTCPDSVSWQDARTVANTTGANAATFSTGQRVGVNQCMWVRVNNQHDDDVTTGTPFLVESGALSDPTGLSVDYNTGTYRATVTATNNVSIGGSFLAGYYYSDQYPNGFCIGIIPSGQTSVTVQCPTYTGAVTFGVMAIVGSYTTGTRVSGITTYAVTPKMRSAVVRDGGSVPVPPTGITLTQTDTVGTVRVTWNWTWTAATACEISWADHEDAWESTEQPSTYEVTNLHASAWNVAGLETGKTWYFRLRLSTDTDGQNKTYGAYSAVYSIDLASAPAIPVLTLSQGVITEDGSVTASWSFTSGDGTAQAEAIIAEVSGNVYTERARTRTAQYVSISAQESEWSTGETHALVVKVISASGRESGWSDPVSISIAEAISIDITQTSLVEQTITTETVERTVLSLTQMPMTITVTGAGYTGVTSVIIERSEDYHLDRPDERDYNGFEGETIAIRTYTGEEQTTIADADLLGRLDDGASYRIIATVQDDYGQSAEATLDFEVHWAHQAIMPEATVQIDNDNLIAKVVIGEPTGTATGDHCDIYRLSADRPELVYEGAEFGETYVDPYPAIGDHGGYRVVYVTANGDYITQDNVFAWIDIEGGIEAREAILDFGEARIRLDKNVDVSNDWSKEFAETKYLGGSVQGDWNPAVSRSSGVSAVGITTDDLDTIHDMRRLAVFAGICNIRTPEGSSYHANVDVSESIGYSSAGKIATYNLKITRVDAEGLDGMPLDEWIDGGT